MSRQQLEAILKMLHEAPGNPDATPAQLRAGSEQMAAMLPAEHDILCGPVDAAGVKAEWVVAPDSDADRAVLYLHGGGYVFGSINTHRALAGRIARAARAHVLLIDYRLAPENPFPAALVDATVAYRWLLSQNFAPRRIAIAGDSAGGGLALSTLVSIRQARLPMAAAGICLSPWTDLAATGESMISRAEIDPMVQRRPLLQMVKYYLGDKDPRTPLASPLYADVSGLPPLLIQVGTAEVLYDDAARMAERASSAGVEVALEPWEEMFHVFQAFAQILDEARQAIARIGEFILAHTP